VLLLRALAVLVPIVLAIYCLVDLVQTRGDESRSLPRPVWALLIVFIPFVGPILWLTTRRRAAGHARSAATEPARPLAPDDNPEFLARLKQHRQRAEDERLRKWQEDLERRERELRRGDDDGGATTDRTAT
jgi:Phospholipase_D-nuclease N-terminal